MFANETRIQKQSSGCTAITQGPWLASASMASEGLLSPQHSGGEGAGVHSIWTWECISRPQHS